MNVEHHASNVREYLMTFELFGGTDRAENVRELFQLAFGKRPAEELYDLERGPAQLKNVAELPEYAEAKRKLQAELEQFMTDTEDPRAFGKGDEWDTQPYYGRSAEK